VLKVALRGIRAHLLQFSLAVLSVVLGIAFISGTFSLRTMLSATFTDIIDTSLVGDAYLRGTTEVPGQDTGPGTPAAYNSIPLDLADEISELPEVRRAIPDVTGPIVLVGADGTAVASGTAPSMAFGFDSDVSTDLGISIVDGAAPLNADQVALETGALEASGLAVGDSTNAIIGGELRDVSVVGEVHFDAAVAGAILTFLDSETANDAFAADGNVQSVTVFASTGFDSDEVTDALNTYLASADATGNVVAVTGADHRADAIEGVTEMLGFIEVFLLIFAAISLFVGGFIIANTFSMSVRQRQSEFALLRAIGAGSSQVFASVIAQALAIGLLGAGIGVGAGVGLVAALRALLGRIGMEMSGSIPLTTQTVVTSLIIGAVVTVVASLLPARRAALTAPVAAMRESVVEVEKPLKLRAAIGGAIGVTGCALVTAAIVDGTSGSGGLLGAGAVAVVIAMLILAPIALRPVLAILTRPLNWIIKPGGKMAGLNLLRNSRRSAATASALMIGMALVGGATVIAASTSESVSGMVEDELNADLVINSATGAIPSEAVAQFQDSEAVDVADPFQIGTVNIAGAETPIAGFPMRGADSTWLFDAVEGDPATLSGNEVSAHTSRATENDWQLGDELELVGAGGTSTVRVGAIVDTQGMSGAGLFLPPDLFNEVIPGAQETTHLLFLRAADGVSVDQLQKVATEIAAPFMVISVLTGAEFSDAQAEMVNQVLTLLYGLLGLAIFIAIMGVANTLVLSLLDRTREIGLLRAVGMGRAQLMGIVTLEALLTAVFGAVIGLGVGVGLAAAMPSVFADSGLAELVIPLPALGALLLIAVIGGLIAALWPAIRASRLPVLESIYAQ